MDIETAKQITKDITECKMMLTNSIKDIAKLEQGKCSKENVCHLAERISKVEGNLSKIVWIVLSAVIGAILMLVLK